MESALLRPEIQEFITANIGADISKLALAKNPFPDVAWPEIVNQVAAKAKAKIKFPTWFTASDIVYPSRISVEQTSSESTALYKSKLVSGHSLIDLTGGFGIDDYYFSKVMEKVVHCEMNEALSEIAAHNFEKLKAANITCYAEDSLQVLVKSKERFDWIYIDPSRRNDAKGKVFMLKDCLPNVPELLHFYFTKSEKILIKTAPILDISAGLSELRHVKAIHVLAVENEVRELLWELDLEFSGQPLVKTANLTKKAEETFEFRLGETANPEFGFPKKYAYEPNAAIMKSGGFDPIAARYNLAKLHQNSHLYSSDEWIAGFPGRIFEINNAFAYTKPMMKQFLENQKANLTTRNFPDSVETIRKKWKIKDGGNSYCFFTTDVSNDKIVLICTKLK